MVWYSLLCPALVFVLLFPDLTSAAECNEGWKANGDYCYMFGHTQMTWYDAQEVCKAFHGILAEPRDAISQEFIGNITQTIGRTFWLGGDDLVTEGQFRWLSDFQPLGYTHWYKRDPNNNGQEDCMAINWHGDGTWVDEECWHKFYYVCQTAKSEDLNIIG